MRLWSLFPLHILLVAAVAVLPDASLAMPGESLPMGPRPAHEARLLVKYRPRVSACAHCLLAEGIPFASVTGSDSLDRLHRRLGIRQARPLFVQDHDRSADRRALFRAGIEAVRQRFPLRAARAASAPEPPDLSNIYVVDLPTGADVEEAAAAYRADPDVEYAQPDYQRHITMVPNDPFFSSAGTWGQNYNDLWGLHITDAATAWDTAIGTGTTVAVIDTGVDPQHPDLAANMWTNPGEIPGNGIDDDGNGFIDDVRGWDFVANDNTPYDLNGHGTHVAGTVAAVGNNGIGVVGMAWGARIMAVRGLDASGRGFDSDLAKAIAYAANNGADVINASWGGLSFNLLLDMPSVLRDAVDAARALGVVFVAAAGNDSADVSYFEPAGYPSAIAVGATTPADALASFSNYGGALSVTAPGVDILSLRAAVSAGVDPYGSVVQSQYLRLQGTSMASPHAAGLSALLLSAQPSLTPDEVRWHLELNADQPGYPGYQGQLWNPVFGFGRINAANVFAPVPVTTRLHGNIDLHLFAAETMNAAATAALSFTTLNAVDWTVSAPSWLPSTPTGGTGSASLSFDADASALAVGPYTGTVTVDAAGAVDGGAGLNASLAVHRDERIGPIARIADSSFPGFLPPPPWPVIADGTGELVLWEVYNNAWPPKLTAARLDGAGNVNAPFTLDTEWYHYPIVGAFDGRNFLVVWGENGRRETAYPVDRITTLTKAVRAGPSGELLDSAPLVLMSRRNSDASPFFVTDVSAGFDGQTYSVLWSTIGVGSPAQHYSYVIGTDGTVRRPKRLIQNVRLVPKTYPSAAARYIQIRDPHVRCRSGGCLLIWALRDYQTTPEGYYIDKVYGAPFVNGAIASVPVLLLQNVNIGAGGIRSATDGTGYIVSGTRVTCSGATTCKYNAAFALVSDQGVPLDSAGVTLKDGVFLESLAFDGNNYVGSFIGGGSRRGTQLFAVRFAPDGRVLDDEEPGLLLVDRSLGTLPVGLGTSMGPSIAALPTQMVVTWVDTVGFDPASATATWTNPISAQRVLAQSLPVGMSRHEIGAIGPQSVAERQVLTFALAASSLNPATTSFTGGNLPPGAVIDPTGIFRWVPDADEAAVYPGVHFEANDGVQTVSEDVTITVGEANLSIGGTVSLSSGTAVPRITVQLRGPASRGRTLSTDSAGHFQFNDLTPGRYGLRLALPSSLQYSMTAQVVTLGAADRKDANLVITPKH